MAGSCAGANIASSLRQFLRRALKQQPPPHTVDVTTRALLCLQRTPATTRSSRNRSNDLSVSLQQPSSRLRQHVCQSVFFPPPVRATQTHEHNDDLLAFVYSPQVLHLQ